MLIDGKTKFLKRSKSTQKISDKNSSMILCGTWQADRNIYKDKWQDNFEEAQCRRTPSVCFWDYR